MVKPVPLLLFLLFAACGAAPRSGFRRARSVHRGRIVGGETVDISQFPWQVSLEHRNDHYCGGSIISKTWILTAAHCCDYGAQNYLLRAGTSTRESGGSVYDISKVIAHGDFDTYSGEYDIGAMSISGTFTFGDNIQAVELATDDPAVGTWVTISGWGDQSYGGNNAPRQLHAVTTQIVDTETCHETWTIITEDMLCTGGNSKGACHGDSGGALVANGTEYGIFSRTFCAMDGASDVYTSVAAFRSWIRRYTGV